MDTYSKYVWSFAMRDKRAATVAGHLAWIFDHFGVPKAIQSDNGAEFKNATMRALLTARNVVIIHGRPRNPRAQGQIERANQTIKHWLAKEIHGTGSHEWTKYLARVVRKYNMTVHRATGRSPFQLFHGQPGYNRQLQVFEYDDSNDLAEVQDPEEYTQLGPLRIGLPSVDLPGAENAQPEEWCLDAQSSDVDLYDSEQVEAPVEYEADTDAAVVEHHARYRARVERNSNSNVVTLGLQVGDEVLLKRDFDNNTTTRRCPFTPFFEDEVYVVVELPANNMIRTTGRVSNTTVFRNRLKKVNSN